jgi:hypothetical protein
MSVYGMKLYLRADVCVCVCVRARARACVCKLLITTRMEAFLFKCVVYLKTLSMSQTIQR